MSYGKELIIDLHNCNPRKFNRQDITMFFQRLCCILEMKREKLCWWDDLYTAKKYRETLPHLKGTSAVQFIKTSNITIHALDILKTVHINIFSCKEYSINRAKRFTKKWFEGEIVNCKVVKRH
jgi:S-adenosylmethionine/arginine decarboxylase-like enzyme